MLSRQTNPHNTILLHVCCADCALKFQSQVSAIQEYIWYFDNSNIHPRTEYLARLSAVKTVAKENAIRLLIADWSPRTWFDAIEQYSDNSQHRRCKLCWKFRLGQTAHRAAKMNLPYFSTTLLTSHFQNKEEIIAIGKTFERPNLHFSENKYHKCDKKTAGFYKQNYCGCVYSLKERYEEKFISTSNSS